MRKIHVIKIIFATILMISFVGCNEEDATTGGALNHISFESNSKNIGVPLDETITAEVLVYASNLDGSDRVFSVEVDMDNTTADSQYYAVPSEFTMTANSNFAKIPVSVTGTNLGSGKTIALKLISKAGLSVGTDILLNITEACFENQVVLSIVFDGYGSETSWEILDNNSNVVASATQGTYSDGQASHNQNLCLPNGSYTFTINDSFGDGLSYPSNGTYELTLDGNVLVSGGGDFGYSSSHNFNL